MKSKGVIVVILLIGFLAVAGGSFWLGTYYQAQSRISRMRQFSGMTPEQFRQRQGEQQRQPGTRQQGPALLTGKVDKVAPDTLTITSRFGSQKINLTPETNINKAIKGDFEDIKVGSQIIVSGEGDPREKIEAESIQILSP